MNKSSQRIGTDQSQNPQNQQDDGYGVKHDKTYALSDGLSSSGTILFQDRFAPEKMNDDDNLRGQGDGKARDVLRPGRSGGDGDHA